MGNLNSSECFTTAVAWHACWHARLSELYHKNVGFEVPPVVVMTSTTIFWDITPYSSLKLKRRFGEIYRLHFHRQRISLARNQRESMWQKHGCTWICFQLVSCSAYFSTLKMEAICSSETSLEFQRTTRRYIAKDSALYIKKIKITFDVVLMKTAPVV
jgi:hypothetical protein